MFLLNGQTLPIDTPFVVDGTSYPSNWLRMTTLEEKQAIGITEVPDPEIYDDRFWWGVGNPKDLAGLKTQWTSQVKETTNKLLSNSDWMVIRKFERNVEIPAETAKYRAAVLAECDRLSTAIDGCADVEALIAVVSAQAWPEV